MTSVVLDTDVVSFLFKNDSRALKYLPHLHKRQWLISFMTEAELEQWALLSNWHAKRIEWLLVFFRAVCGRTVFSGSCPQVGGSDGDRSESCGDWRQRMRGSRRPQRSTMLRS
jgi:hypothetical protein